MACMLLASFTSNLRLHCSAALGASPLFTAPSTGAQFMFNSTPQGSSQAQAACLRNGGHLAAFTSQQEQLEVGSTAAYGVVMAVAPCDVSGGARQCCDAMSDVHLCVQVEQHFISAGYLYAEYHRFYWLGLRADASNGSWYWLDATISSPNPAAATYANWAPSEPDGFPSELCGGGDLSRGINNAAGWADANCSRLAPFMCRVMGASRAASSSSCVLVLLLFGMASAWIICST